MNTIYETMTKVSLGHSTVRVWRSSAVIALGPDPEIQATIRNIQRLMFDTHSVEDTRLAILQKIASMPGVEAVEVLDPNGNGGLVYPDWK